MNIIEKIKQILSKTKQKALPEGTQNKNNRNSFITRLHTETNSHQKNVVKNPYLEHCITQFFEKYKEISEKRSSNTMPPSFYSILININALDGNAYCNAEPEEELLDSINNSKDYTLDIQSAGKNNTPIFYHISNNRYILPDDDDLKRIYINCKNENVAKLAQSILYYNQDTQLYFKASSTEYMAANNRSEKLVIYSSNYHFRYYLDLLNQIKQIHPKLFEGSEKNNPFMPTIDGFAYANQPLTDHYTLLDGSTIQISKTPNSFISQTIEESYMETLRDLAVLDPELQFLTEPENIDDSILYAGAYDYVNSHYHAQLINSIEEKMKYLCDINNIEINGITCSKNIEKYKFINDDIVI